jgi:CRP/FNR family cyclic AMP-dependent transcriptional regulator
MQRVRLADRDPDLFSLLQEQTVAAAREVATAAAIGVPAGPWRFEGHRFSAERVPGGLLVVDGLLCRTVRLGNRAAMELLGPEDVIRPWVRMGQGSAIAVDGDWRVHEDATLAVLDRSFLRRVAPWPELTAVLMDRLVMRTRWLSFTLAVCSLRGVERRLLLMLWHYADRWGRVTPDGVLVPHRLTHGLLASAVAATRPTVATAAARLSADGLAERVPGGGWLLKREPPAEVTAISVAKAAVG